MIAGTVIKNHNLFKKLESELQNEYLRYVNVNHPLPYEYSLQNGNNELFYFGTKHTCNPEDREFNRIKTIFERFKPEVVFAEGVLQLHDAERSQVFQDTIAKLNECEAAQKGENIFTVHCGLKYQCRIICPEPTIIDETEYISKNGYSKEHIVLFYISKFLSRQRDAEPSDYIKKGLQYLKRNLKWDFDFSWTNFVSIHSQIIGKSEQYGCSDMYKRLTDPVPRQENKTLFQTNIPRISYLSNIYRDCCIILNILDCLKNDNKLLVVFGATHAYVQKSLILNLLRR